MLTVGDTFPEFHLEACVSREKGKEFEMISSEAHKNEGKWMVIFFWSKDFSLVCPTEIKSFNDHYNDFKDNNALLYGASTDTALVHLAWRDNHNDLKDLKLPMISDHSKNLSSSLGILIGADQIDLRATFIVNPKGIIKWVSVNDPTIGRSVDETLRVLKALQTNEFCPCDWKEGEETIKV